MAVAVEDESAQAALEEVWAITLLLWSHAELTCKFNAIGTSGNESAVAEVREAPAPDAPHCAGGDRRAGRKP
ncbi:hypothetical protein [Streptomyces sp. NPDC050564]|uniref:hypothetical protein n=1 Tax=Streptomyces sp. NPDC050564 TaxID=3365631 RepID=UPI0037B1639A